MAKKKKNDLLDDTDLFKRMKKEGKKIEGYLDIIYEKLNEEPEE